MQFDTGWDALKVADSLVRAYQLLDGAPVLHDGGGFTVDDRKIGPRSLAAWVGMRRYVTDRRDLNILRVWASCTAKREPVAPRYRDRLDRNIHLFGLITLGFCLHNPSTADEVADDPTVHRCVAFADALGATRLVIVNAWAGRATDPAALWRLDDPVGPGCDAAIAAAAREVAESGGFMIAGWGAISAPAARRGEALERLIAVETLIWGGGCGISALAVNADGAPQHPLYIRAGARPLPWTGTAGYRAALEPSARRGGRAPRHRAADRHEHRGRQGLPRYARGLRRVRDQSAPRAPVRGPLRSRRSAASTRARTYVGSATFAMVGGGVTVL